MIRDLACRRVRLIRDGKNRRAAVVCILHRLDGAAGVARKTDSDDHILSADAQELLEGAGVTVHFERQTADAPTQVGGLVPLLLDKSKSVILDVGGNDTGARLIGGYAHLLKSADAWFVVNPYRPWSGTVEHIDGTLSAVLKAARLGLPRFLLNPTLGIGTTAEEFLVGVEQGLQLLTPYVKVEAAAVSETLLPEVEGRTELPLLPITPRMTVPETGLDEG